MRKILLLISIIILSVSCKKVSNEPQADAPKLTAAKLIFPHNNALCTVGTNITTLESTVLFEWEPVEHADSYELILKDLLTGNFTTFSSLIEKIPIVLMRDNPYKWYVISKSNTISDTVHSASWKFHNAGPASISSPPFPADIVSPAMASSFNAVNNIVTLDWNGIDVDNDIVSYDVHFGTVNLPPLFQPGVTTSVLNDVHVTPGTIYYWEIITNDANGNQSRSGVYQFKIN